jgi:hypothetical protein
MTKTDITPLCRSPAPVSPESDSGNSGAVHMDGIDGAFQNAYHICVERGLPQPQQA